MASNEKLKQDMEALAERLEEHPDPWFDHPKGWLLRPSYKRSAQERGSFVKRKSWTDMSLKEMVGGSAYMKRWFVLDLKRNMFKYYADETAQTEKWSLNLSNVRSVKVSTVFDAPPYSLDLITADMHFTIAAANSEEMVRWALVLDNALRNFNKDIVGSETQHRRQSNSTAMVKSRDTVLLGNGDEEGEEDEEAEDVVGGQKEMGEEERWYRYDFTFPRQGPLMMNVMGTVDHDEGGEVVSYWIIITSFARDPDGTQGVAEKSGKIRVKDYIVGVNGADLTCAPFQEAMVIIREATWPKTLHFLRDNTASVGTVFLECWAHVFYPSLNKPRKRYIELRFDCINFRKPTPGGSAMLRRDAFFNIEQVTYLRPRTDHNLPPDQKYCLTIVCNASSVIHNVDWQDKSVGVCQLESLELFFSDFTTMNEWCQTLAYPSLRQDDAICIGIDIPIAQHETVEHHDGDVGAPPVTLYGIKSSVTGQFSQREFELEKGFLTWRRPQKQGDRKTRAMSKGRRMFIADSKGCGLRGIRAISDNYANPNYRFQIVLQSVDDRIVMGLPDETSLMQWLDAFRELIDEAPPASRRGLVVPDTAAEMGRALTTTTPMQRRHSEDDDEPMSTPGHLEDDELALIEGVSDDALQGMLFYKHNVQFKFSWKRIMSHYWFLLRNGTLHYYKNQYDVAFQSRSLGKIDLRNVMEIRESDDLAAPENSFELVTPGRVYLLTADTEEEMMRWIDGLSDALEARVTALRADAAEVDGSRNSMIPDSQSRRNSAPASFLPSSLTGSSGGGKSGASPLETALQKRRAIVYEGFLTMKNVNKMTFLTSWKKRYVVLTNRILTYFTNAEEVFMKNKDNSWEISLESIAQIESSRDAKCAKGCGFDVYASDEAKKGLKAYSFEAENADVCREWMEKICAATGKFVLKKNFVGYFSEPIENSPPQVRSPSKDPTGANRGSTSEKESVEPTRNGRAAPPTATSAAAMYQNDGIDEDEPALRGGGGGGEGEDFEPMRRKSSGIAAEPRTSSSGIADSSAANRLPGRGRGFGRGMAFAAKGNVLGRGDPKRRAMPAGVNHAAVAAAAKQSSESRRHTISAEGGGRSNAEQDDQNSWSREEGSEAGSGSDAAAESRQRFDSVSSTAGSISEELDAKHKDVSAQRAQVLDAAEVLLNTDDEVSHEQTLAPSLESENTFLDQPTETPEVSEAPETPAAPLSRRDEIKLRLSQSAAAAGRRGGRGGRGRGPGF